MIHLMQHYKLDAEALSQLDQRRKRPARASPASPATSSEIEEAANEGHHRALLAHKAYCYQIRKNIGAYVAAMGGVDVLAFTGRIGETSAAVRSLACQGLGYMGIKLDEEKNRNLGQVRSHADDLRRRFAGEDPGHRQQRRARWSPGKPCAPSSATRSTRPSAASRQRPIPIEVSAHHVHLAQADVDKLFGPGHQLTPEHELSQPGQFACAREGPSGRTEGQDRQRARARSDAQGNPGRDRHDRAVQARHPAADPRIGRPRGIRPASRWKVRPARPPSPAA